MGDSPKVKVKFRSVERLTVYRIVVCEGTGVEGNPFREVAYYYDEHAKFLWYDDPAESKEVS